MLLENLFSNVDVKTVKATLYKYRVEIPDNYSFSNVNLVIGPNGAGKTRFLHAIKELYALDNSRDNYGIVPRNVLIKNKICAAINKG